MANDLWQTPPEVMKYLEKCELFVPTVDACASDTNTKCETYFTEENSFLDDRVKLENEQVWCNPPYSNPLPFIKKCHEVSLSNSDVFMILNMDTSTKWFKFLESHYNVTIMPVVGGRIAFVNLEDGAKRKNNKAQVIIKFKGVTHYRETLGNMRARWLPVYIDEINKYKDEAEN